jgi:type II secretory pathway component PulC
MLLAIAVVFFGYQTSEVWFASDKQEANEPARSSQGSRAHRRVAYRRNPPYKTYEVIAQKNLFSSDRREELPETSPAPSVVQPSKPLDSRFALFGIVIEGNEKKALVSNLNKKTPMEKEYIWVKVGDKIGNLNISEIGPQQVTVTEGGSSHTVRLSDQSYPQKRSGVRTSTRRTRSGTIEIKKSKVKNPEAKGSNTSS